MGKAKECDRCGELYVDTHEKDILILGMWICREATRDNTSDTHYDLCPKCGAALDKWFKNKNQEDKRDG